MADGHPWALITAVVGGSSRTVARRPRRFQHGGLPAVLGRPRGAPARLGPRGRDRGVGWVTQHRPRACGFFRSRRCCALLALLLRRADALLPATEQGQYRALRSAALYRAGRYDAVVREPEPSRKFTTRAASLTDCRRWFFVAMAHQRLGHRTEAWAWLARATQALEVDTQNRDRGPGELWGHGPWGLSLSARLLRAEAEALILGKAMKPGG